MKLVSRTNGLVDHAAFEYESDNDDETGLSRVRRKWKVQKQGERSVMAEALGEIILGKWFPENVEIVQKIFAQADAVGNVAEEQGGIYEDARNGFFYDALVKLKTS